MIYFTGSKAHNIRIREMAVRQGLKLNEYGLFRAKTGRAPRGRDRGGGLRTSRPSVHRAHLAGGPRRDRGRARGGATRPGHPATDQGRPAHPHEPHRRPRVAGADARGGRRAPLRVLRGHRPRAEPVHAAHDRREDARSARRLRALQDRFPSMRLLHGTELNIDPDGGVDWDEDFLGGFDLTVASVHSHFTQSKDQMTRRVDPRDRASRRQHHRAPDHAQDRPPRSGRSRSRGGVRGRGTRRHGAGDQRVPRPARPAGRARAVGPADTACGSRSIPTPTPWGTSTSCASASRPLSAAGSRRTT